MEDQEKYNVGMGDLNEIIDLISKDIEKIITIFQPYTSAEARGMKEEEEIIRLPNNVIPFPKKRR